MAESNEIKPLVSVLMTAYNREKYIGEAIESVLASTYTNFELIIVDDVSKDKTVEISKSYEAKDNRIKVYINEVNLGDYPNRNKAASYAKGKYLKYLDSDDLIYKHSLQIMVEAMEFFPEAALGITSKNPISYSPFPMLLSPKEAFNKHFFHYGLLDFGPSGVIINRAIFLKTGMFSGKRLVGDFECWTKLAMHYPIIELQSSLIFWRQHEGQEFNIGKGKIDEGYFLYNYPLLKEILANDNCPLEKSQKRILIKKQSREYFLHIFKYILKTGDFKKAYQTCIKLGLRFKNIF